MKMTTILNKPCILFLTINCRLDV